GRSLIFLTIGEIPPPPEPPPSPLGWLMVKGPGTKPSEALPVSSLYFLGLPLFFFARSLPLRACSCSSHRLSFVGTAAVVVALSSWDYIQWSRRRLLRTTACSESM
ncbi:unnamed protein product, partial [Brassica oleracea var. botrytis]